MAGPLKMRQTHIQRSLSLARKDCLGSAENKGMLGQSLLKLEVLLYL